MDPKIHAKLKIEYFKHHFSSFTFFTLQQQQGRNILPPFFVFLADTKNWNAHAHIVTNTHDDVINGSEKYDYVKIKHLVKIELV